MDQVSKKNPFMSGALKGKIPSFMEGLPGAFNPRRGSTSSALAGSSSSMVQGAGAGVREPLKSTKQVCAPW
jgi:hypothetical protein